MRFAFRALRAAFASCSEDTETRMCALGFEIERLLPRRRRNDPRRMLLAEAGEPTSPALLLGDRESGELGSFLLPCPGLDMGAECGCSASILLSAAPPATRCVRRTSATRLAQTPMTALPRRRNASRTRRASSRKCLFRRCLGRPAWRLHRMAATSVMRARSGRGWTRAAVGAENTRVHCTLVFV